MGTKTFHRGVLDAKIAAWNGVASYGTAYDIMGIRNATINLVIDSDELGGDDAILDQFSVIEAVTISWEQAAVDLEALDIMLGGTLVSNAAYEDMVLGRQADSGLPYFAFAFAVTGSAGHSLQIFVPKMKVEGNLQFSAQYKQYLLPGASIKGVYEGEANGVARWRKFASATTLTIPLATAVN